MDARNLVKSYLAEHTHIQHSILADLHFQQKSMEKLCTTLVYFHVYILVRGPWDEDNTAFVQEATEAIEYLTERTNLDVEMDIWKPGLFDDDDDEYDDDE